MTPTARSLKYLREAGYRAQVVEKWNPAIRVRNDLFGIGDILALRDAETLLVQTTSASNVSARVKKIATADALPDIRRAGWSIHVHGWRKSGRKWVVRVVDVS